MSRYLIKKFVTLVILLFLVTWIVFGVLFLLPGDPAQVILGINATPQTLANLRNELGLDQPAWRQYADWIGGLLSGAGSRSIHYDVPVFELIATRLAVTGPLAMMAMLLALAVSLPLGVYAACHQHRAGDMSVMTLTQLGLATPEFWLGILLILLFSVHLGWLPSGGFPGWSHDVRGSFRALILPAFALGIVRVAVLTRVTRSAVLDVLQQDYVRTARAKGLRERTVLYVHALLNALIPVLTILGLQMGQLLAGAVIVENVFYLPGIGRLVLQSIGQRDLPVVREIVLFMAAAVVIIHFLVDVAYAWVDPRIRIAG